MPINDHTAQAQATNERQIAQFIGMQVVQYLENERLLQDGDDTAVYVWPLADRVVLVFDPMQVKRIQLLASQRFLHELGTVLQGRKIAVMNHRGIFFQVAYWPEPALELVSHPLDLSRQPSPLHVPIGVTKAGDLWLSLPEMDAVLIGGARRMGKTNLLHGWIAALLQGKETRLVIFDGKAGVEFVRYSGKPRCQVITEHLAPALGELFAEMNKRFDILKEARVANLAEYNRGRGEGARLERIALTVDELAVALDEPGVEDVLVDLIARGGAVGIHPVLATQRPSSDVVTPRLKGNLVTRIALPVPDRASSMVVLDRSGAETLSKTPGRLLIAHSARLIEAQAFLAPSVTATADVPELPASARLSERERRIAQAAIASDGWYRIRELKDDTGEGGQFLIDLARRWEILGYLTPVLRNDQGHQLGRRITDKLRAELGEQANKANEVEQGERGEN